MRLLIVTAVSMSMLIPGAFAQSSVPSASPSDRAAAAKALRHSDLRMQAQSEEPQTPTLQSTEQQHPEWFKETNRYKPCRWDMCPSPPPQ
jgi:hypothetical protein